ncbi:MAG TPA: hypothetical protein V6C65_33900 [Allocoleopsis sp.]
MTIEIINQLIDRCLQLVRHDEQPNDAQHNQQFYSEFFVSTLSDLEELHKHYMENFKTYRELIQWSDMALDSTHPIFEQIKQDSQLSSELRTKTLALRSFEHDPVVGSFVYAVAIYTLGQEVYASYLIDGFYGIPDAPDIKVIQGLKEIFQAPCSTEEKKQKALKTIDELIAERQDDYRWVSEEHSNLQSKFLGLN